VAPSSTPSAARVRMTRERTVHSETDAIERTNGEHRASPGGARTPTGGRHDGHLYSGASRRAAEECIAR
jgi:hypothetical protein